MKDHNRYCYRQVDDSQIRLVSIAPRQGKKGIRLKLETVSIDDVDGHYEAVSYMWGSTSATRHVLVDGKTLRLRDNLWRCLKHLRDHNLTRARLWIDSICINQNDEQEKSQQVAKMAQIFRNASKVLIWLGSTSMQTYLLPPKTESLEHSIENLPPKDLDAWIDVLGHSDPKSQSLENQIMSIIYNPYWERLWIVQEVALAQDACIVFGKALLDKDCFSPMYHAARENSKPGYRSWIAVQRDPNIRKFTTEILDHHPILRVCQNKKYTQHDHLNSLTNLIHDFHRQTCADPRDYVFGLMGLLESSPTLEIDYTSSSEDLAFRALLHLEEEGKPEGAEEASHQPALNLSAAADLMKALGVTSLTFSAFEQNLPLDRAEAIQSKRFNIRFGPWMHLTSEDEVSPPDETRAYEEVIQTNVSGKLKKNIYKMKHHDFIQVRLLDGHIKQFGIHRNSNHLERKSRDLLWCSLHGFPTIMIRWDPDDDHSIEIKHFILPDMTCPPHESAPQIEIQIPKSAQNALTREINACGIDWNDLYPDAPAHSFLHFSTSELISICELIATKEADIAEFWNNS